MPVYRPRVACVLNVPTSGNPNQRAQQSTTDQTFRLACRVSSCSLDFNNFNEADACDLTIEYDDAGGIDPRFLKSAEVYVYLGDTPSGGEVDQSLTNLRFIGIVVDVERQLSVSSGKRLRIRALDYTTLFIETKGHFPAEGIPDYSQTLREAWTRICKYTGYPDISKKEVVSTVTRLANRLEFFGNVNESEKLGAAVSSRLAKNGKLQVHPGADAWHVWQTAVRSLGLITYIRNDRCIVTTATDYFTSADPPRFVWGRNISEMTERRNMAGLSGKNICLFAFDPITGRVVEAFWPPLDDPKAKQKRHGASAAAAPGDAFVTKAESYDVFNVDVGITDVGFLTRYAKRIWEERVRQEMTGSLVTPNMIADTVDGDVFDLLKLQAGDRVRVELERETLSAILALPSKDARLIELVARGYPPEFALLYVTNLDSIASLPADFQVHSVHVQFEVSATSGTFSVSIQYLNRIDVSGGAVSDAPSVEVRPPPPVTGQRAIPRKVGGDSAGTNSTRKQDGVGRRAEPAAVGVQGGGKPEGSQSVPSVTSDIIGDLVKKVSGGQ